MKRLIGVLTFAMVMGSVLGQTAKVVSAYNYLRNGQLDKAKEAIDPSITHEKTMGAAKTWFYRGNVYLAIQLSDDPKYQGLSTQALEIAHESYAKAVELDQKKEYAGEIQDRFLIISEQFYNRGVTGYNNQTFAQAAQDFIKAKDINASFGRIDTLSIFNAALCSELAGDAKTAKSLYLQLIEVGYHNTIIYSSLAGIYKDQGDTAKAESVIRQGRTKHPNDFNLIIAETNHFLGKGDLKGARGNLELAIQLDKTNPTIFFAVGTTYDQMGEKEKAEAAYKQAIELDPTYFDPQYNLGALYVNRAATIIEEANKLPLNDPKYDTEKAKADKFLNDALPYLEKANEINPQDRDTLIALKEIYARTNQLEKLKRVNEALQNLINQ